MGFQIQLWLLVVCGLVPCIIAQNNPISILPYPFPSSGLGGLAQFFRPQQFPNFAQIPNGQQFFSNLLNPLSNLFRPRPTTAPTQPQPGQPQSGQTQPGQTQPDQTQPGQTQPGQTQPGQTQPGQTQPGQTQPGQTQLGQTVQIPPINSVPPPSQNQSPAAIVPPNVQGSVGDYFQVLPNPPQTGVLPSQNTAVQGKRLYANQDEYPSSKELYESIQNIYGGQPHAFIEDANQNEFPYFIASDGEEFQSEGNAPHENVYPYAEIGDHF